MTKEIILEEYHLPLEKDSIYKGYSVNEFDFIQRTIVIPKPEFNWDDVEWGMCFYSRVDKINVWYIGENINQNSYSEHIVATASKDTCGKMKVPLKRDLTRVPENDIKVK